MPRPIEYPEDHRARDHWILAHREGIPRRKLDPYVPYQFLAEEERSANGELVSVATLFLTNRECPWRCLMCDLWRNTLTETVPIGAIPTQIDFALARLPSARQIKLYNSGSFFDPGAIPVADYPEIAARVTSFERVIVESHPRFIGPRCWDFRDLISGRLEVAMGLETVHPEVSRRLNKQITPEQFAEAAAQLREHGVDLRVFILAKPPFLDDEEASFWTARSLEFAFECGATVAVIIPTRPGNGALDRLAALGEFSRPSLRLLEEAVEHGINLKRGRVFVDLWDLEQFAKCTECFGARLERLRMINAVQKMLSPVNCSHCSASL